MERASCDLYRSVLKEEYPDGPIVDGHAVVGVLYPDFAPRPIVRDGRVVGERAPDTAPRIDEHLNLAVVDTGAGTSLFDKPNFFGTKNWFYFRIPKSTKIPASLRIRFTHDTRFGGHHQIEPAMNRMPVDAYKGALDNLARNAILQAYEDAR